MSTIPYGPGIYQITCTTTGKFYIGSSNHVAHRLGAHRGQLRRDIHVNKRLQHAWNKYGEEAFTFTLLEECAVEELIQREQYYIDLTRSWHRSIGFNLRTKAASKGILQKIPKQLMFFNRNVGTKHQYSEKRAERNRRVWTGRNHKPESIAKMQAVKKGKVAYRNTYIVTDPSGIEYHVFDLKLFCHEHDLMYRTISRLARTGRANNQGWRCQFEVRHRTK